MAGIIHILDSETIDKIAAGEVVERPASVVKELVENSIDAGADKITVEIRDGGTTFIRVTDNGCGIAKEDLTNAFMRHATSKITVAEDLSRIESLGFRGEALSSISAVSMVEMITKKADTLTGVKVSCNGGAMEQPEEVGAPDGTTILVRNLFYNTPARRKFLKTSMTEAGYVAELMQHIALSRPEIAVSYIQNGQNRFFTSGNGDLSEVIYRIFGRDVANALIPVSRSEDGVTISGFIGKPILCRASRAYENFFVNGRYIKSKEIGIALEEGFRTYLMQHKYPFAVLHFTISGENIDVNVHPTKTEIRIMNPQPFLLMVRDTVKEALKEPVLIPDYEETNVDQLFTPVETKEKAPEPFETRDRLKKGADDKEPPAAAREEEDMQAEPGDNARMQAEPGDSTQPQKEAGETLQPRQESVDGTQLLRENAPYKVIGNPEPKKASRYHMRQNVLKPGRGQIITKAEQMSLFSEKLEEMGADAKLEDFAPIMKEPHLEIIGQIFKTYWIVTYDDKLYFVDQHAAHEKIKYERWMEHLRDKSNASQMLMPPIIVSMTSRELNVFREYRRIFRELGFLTEEFGKDEIALRGIPQDLYGVNAKELFLTVLDEILASPVRGTPEVITAKLASMSCKAAVKGNQMLTVPEAEELLKELFSLENPYNCPHGRPTMFSMSRQELEKKFKRSL